VHLTGAEQANLVVNSVDGHLVEDDQIRSARQAGVVGGGELQIDVDVLDRTQVRGSCSLSWSRSSPKAIMWRGVGLGDMTRLPSWSSQRYGPSSPRAAYSATVSRWPGVTLHQADCLIGAVTAGIGAARLATGNAKDFPMREVTVEEWPPGS